MSPSKVWPPAAACDATRKCILVVEDELLIRFMLSDGLRDEGYHVIEACNADEALTILQSAIPDLLISDVRMPGTLDGLELMKTVRETQSDLPVIIISGHLDPSAAKAEGAIDFISKPYLMETVFQAVRNVLGGAT
jgi:DNA-binding NtrC family response regulator